MIVLSRGRCRNNQCNTSLIRNTVNRGCSTDVNGFVCPVYVYGYGSPPVYVTERFCKRDDIVEEYGLTLTPPLEDPHAWVFTCLEARYLTGLMARARSWTWVNTYMVSGRLSLHFGNQGLGCGRIKPRELNIPCIWLIRNRKRIGEIQGSFRIDW